MGLLRRSWVFWLAGTLLLVGAVRPEVRFGAWLALGVACVAAMLAGPVRGRSPRVRQWRVAAGATAVGMVADVVGESGVWLDRTQSLAVSTVFDVVVYLITVVIAVSVLSERARQATWLGVLDGLVLLATLITLSGTVSILLISDRTRPSGEGAHILSGYLGLDLLVLLGVLVMTRDQWRGLGRETWLAFCGVGLMLVTAVGLIATDRQAFVGWTLAFNVGWLAGLAMVSAVAVIPYAPVDSSLQRLHVSPGLANWILVLALAVGPPLELLDPSLVNLVTLLLVAVGGLALSEARRRMVVERATRTAAAGLAGAADTYAVVSATIAAVAEIAPAQRAILGVVGPDGLRVGATRPVDAEVADRDRDMSPPEFLKQRFGPSPHDILIPPTRPPHAVLVALGLGGARRFLGHRLAALENLVAQAELAANRLLLTAELSRRASEQYFQSVVANASDMIVTVDDSGRVRYASPSAHATLGALELTGGRLADVVGEDNALWVRRAAGDRSAAHWRIAIDGATMEVDARVADLRADPAVQGMVVTLRDVTEQTVLNRRLEHLAYHDQLTGVGNLAWFAERYQEAVESCRRAWVALTVDLDRAVAKLSHLRGRETGQELMIAMARRLLDTGYLVARLDGSRFAVLASAPAPTAAAAADLACGLHARIAVPFRLGSARTPVEVNLGAAVVDDQVGVDEALRRTSLAVAAANSRSRWRVFEPPMLTDEIERESLRSDLAAAIDNDGLELHYQPIVDLTTGQVCGFEALARWLHPTRGAVMPDIFIPLAENTGLIGGLGRWVLRRAVRDAARLRSLVDPERELHVSVNVAAQQLTDPGFAREVVATVAAADLPQAAICLEITERTVLDGTERNLEILRELKRSGLLLAIDDFGTGHSALSYLLELPVDVLKLDRSFTADIETSPPRAQLVAGIIRLADAADLTTLAEGVETERQQDILQAAGCRYVQGFRYSPAVPLPEAEKFLDRTWI
ncbi:MAG: EAL domain-containing protein [Mycobacteriaceae bacterium]|nr:EAL domain-containing protein [Mycobacteriaceae bacterium]